MRACGVFVRSFVRAVDTMDACVCGGGCCMCKSSAEVAAAKECVRAGVRGRRKERKLWQREPAKRPAVATTARAGQAQLAVKVMREGITLALHLRED
jgi:hypothetical protein